MQDKRRLEGGAPRRRARLLRGLGWFVAGLGCLAGGPQAASAAALTTYIANFDSNTVSLYDIGAGGNLAPRSPAVVGADKNPESVAVSPDGKSVYVTNQGSNTVSQYSVGTSGALVSKSTPTVAAGTSPAGVAVSPDGRSLYVTNFGSATVSQYDVGSGGALAPKSPATVAAGGAPAGVAVAPDGRSVYVASAASNSVSQYSVGANGALAAKSPATVAAGGGSVAVAVTPDGRSVYVANVGSNSVSQYDVGSGGALAPKSPATVAADSVPIGVAVTPDGRSVYVANELSDTVSQYSVGANGALAAKSPATVAAGDAPIGVAVTPDSTSVYVTNQNSNSVSQYDVGLGGALAAKSPATVAAGSTPIGVAVTTDQGPVAAFSVTAAASGSPTRFDGSSSSDSDGGVARYDWDFGDGTVALNAGPAPSHTYPVPGAYTATLTVSDDSGCSTAQVFTGQTLSCNGTAAARSSRVVGVSTAGSAPGGMASGFDTRAPSVSGYRVTNNPFVVAGGSTPTFGSAATVKKHKKGTTFRYKLSEAAAVRIVISQRRSGRRRGTRCLASTRGLRRGRRCTRLTRRATLVRVSRKGANSVPFSGRLKSRVLSTGRYQAIVTATDAAGNTSRGKTIFFTIVAR